MTISRPTPALACLLLLASPLLAAATFDYSFWRSWYHQFIINYIQTSSIELLISARHAQWPGAYCVQSRCWMPTTGPLANDFSTWGLWTYDSTGEPITKCSSSPFYVKQDLNAHWSNLKCPSNNGVGNWRKAWKQFGVCSGLEEAEYFKTALQLRSQVDVLSLKPSLLYVYGLSEITDAIKEGIGATPLVRCRKGLLGQFQLYEIYICVDKDGKTAIDCPVQPKYTRGEEVFFTPFFTGNLTNIDASPDRDANAHIEMVVPDFE